MPFNLKNRHFLTIHDFSPKEVLYLLDLARDLKRAKYAGVETQRLRGKNVALIFEKDSTRTRCAFEVACYDQGANVTYLGPSGSQIGQEGVDEGHGAGPRPDVRRASSTAASGRRSSRSWRSGPASRSTTA